MLDTLMDALGYAGDVMAKPGRAVRGVLGGRPDEILAALPFSDTIGLTDQANAVSGSDLAGQLGLGEGTMRDVAGFGIEMATDPLSYLGIGAAAKVGQNAGRILGTGGVRKAASAANEPGVYNLLSDSERAINALGDAPIPTMGAAPRAVRPVAFPDGFQAIDEASYPFPKGANFADDVPMFAEPGAPHPSYYAHDIGLHPDGYYDPAGYGIVSDAMQDGAPRDLLMQLGLGGWKKPIDDLAQGSWVPPEWDQAVGRRADDLRAWQKVAEYNPHLAAAHGPAVDEQLRAIQKAAGNGLYASSPGGIAVRDLERVTIPLKDVPSHAGEGLAHLGIGPAEMKRFAAKMQQAEIDDHVRRGLSHYREGDPITAEQLVGSYPVEHLKTDLTRLLFPGAHAAGGAPLEPNLIRQYFRNPPADIAAEIQAARDARSEAIRLLNYRPAEL